MNRADAVSKVKRDCLIVSEFLTDDDIGAHLDDVLGDATDYTATMVDEAIVNMLRAILPVTPKEYRRGSISITRENIRETLREFQAKTGVGSINLYRGDETTWNDGDGM